MPNNTLAGLRDHLFETIERLKSKEDPMDIDRARAVSEVAKTIIDTAKVEIGYIRVTDAHIESDFIGTPSKPRQSLPAGRQQPGAGNSSDPVAELVFECVECGMKFDDQAGLENHTLKVRQTGRHPRAVAVMKQANG